MSTPPNCSATRSNAARTEAGAVTSQARPSAVPPSFLAAASAALPSMSSNATSAPASDHRARSGEADGAGAAGHHRDLAGERLFGGLAEFGLFERPVFDVEEIGLADRFEPADRLGVGHGLDRRLGEVGGDSGVPGIAAEPEEAEPRHQDDPRHRVELALRHRLARVVAGEIGVVVGDETIDRLAHRGLEPVETAGLGRRHDQRIVLGADRVVGGGDAGLAIAARARRR